MLWRLIEFHHIDVGQVADVVDPCEKRYAASAAYVQEYFVRSEDLVVDADLASTFKAGMAANKRTTRHARQPSFKAGAICATNRSDTRFDGCHINTRRASGQHTILGAAGSKAGD